MPIKLIGRTNNFYGKTLWEILGNLKNFGVGRIIARSVFERYPEPSYIKIIKVEPLPNEEGRKVRVWAERTFRGRKLPKVVEICSVSYKADYKLIPKDQEIDYCKVDSLEKSIKIFPPVIDLPPLLKDLILKEKQAKGEQIVDFKIPIQVKQSTSNVARTAKEGEMPNSEFIIGLGIPASPELYKGIIE